MKRESLTTLIALLVSLVWLSASLTSLVIRDYTALSIITPVMLIVVGFLYGKAGKNGNGNSG